MMRNEVSNNLFANRFVDIIAFLNEYQEKVDLLKFPYIFIQTSLDQRVLEIRFNCFILMRTTKKPSTISEEAHTYSAFLHVRNMCIPRVYVSTSECEGLRCAVDGRVAVTLKRDRAFRLAHCGTAERQCRQLAVARQNR